MVLFVCACSIYWLLCWVSLMGLLLSWGLGVRFVFWGFGCFGFCLCVFWGFFGILGVAET